MKTLTQYITELSLNEAFRINKDTKIKHEYNYRPETRQELRKLIIKLIKERGKDANLNDIDVSGITDMTQLFSTIDGIELGNKIGNIDISEWDVSNVTKMNGVFYGCKNFDSDLLNWDVSKVETMFGMFHGCTKFNSDLSSWDVSNVKDMRDMFNGCYKFNCDLSKWNVSNVKDMVSMFMGCDSLQKTPDWYKK